MVGGPLNCLPLNSHSGKWVVVEVSLLRVVVGIYLRRGGEGGGSVKIKTSVLFMFIMYLRTPTLYQRNKFTYGAEEKTHVLLSTDSSRTHVRYQGRVVEVLVPHTAVDASK